MFSPHDFTVLASPQTAVWSCVRLGLVWTRSLRPRLRARGLVRPSARFPDALSVRRGQTQQTAPLRAPLRAFAHAEHARFLAVQMEETRHRHRPGSPLRPSWSPLPQGHRPPMPSLADLFCLFSDFRGGSVTQRVLRARFLRRGSVLRGNASPSRVHQLMDIRFVSGLGLSRRKLSGKKGNVNFTILTMSRARMSAL